MTKVTDVLARQLTKQEQLHEDIRELIVTMGITYKATFVPWEQLPPRPPTPCCNWHIDLYYKGHCIRVPHSLSLDQIRTHRQQRVTVDTYEAQWHLAETGVVGHQSANGGIINHEDIAIPDLVDVVRSLLVVSQPFLDMIGEFNITILAQAYRRLDTAFF